MDNSKKENHKNLKEDTNEPTFDCKKLNINISSKYVDKLNCKIESILKLFNIEIYEYIMNNLHYKDSSQLNKNNIKQLLNQELIEYCKDIKI